MLTRAAAADITGCHSISNSLVVRLPDGRLADIFQRHTPQDSLSLSPRSLYYAGVRTNSRRVFTQMHLLRNAADDGRICQLLASAPFSMFQAEHIKAYTATFLL